MNEYNPTYKDGIIYTIDYYTDGAATSANHVISNSDYIDEPWLIVDCDFVLDLNFKSLMESTDNCSVVLVENSPWDKKSSYSCVDDYMNIHGVAEKQPISKFRNTGQYHLKAVLFLQKHTNFLKIVI